MATEVINGIHYARKLRCFTVLLLSFVIMIIVIFPCTLKALILLCRGNPYFRCGVVINTKQFLFFSSFFHNFSCVFPCESVNPLCAVTTVSNIIELKVICELVMCSITSFLSDLRSFNAIFVLSIQVSVNWNENLRLESYRNPRWIVTIDINR